MPKIITAAPNSLKFGAQVWLVKNDSPYLDTAGWAPLIT